MQLLCYPTCSTCQATKKKMNLHQISYEERNIKEENPTVDELREWWEKSGLPLKKFFNTSGLLYKSLQLKDKLKDMSDSEQLELLSSDGMLVKRPLLLDEAGVFLGKKDILMHFDIE